MTGLGHKKTKHILLIPTDYIVSEFEGGITVRFPDTSPYKNLHIDLPMEEIKKHSREKLLSIRVEEKVIYNAYLLNAWSYEIVPIAASDFANQFKNIDDLMRWMIEARIRCLNDILKEASIDPSSSNGGTSYGAQ